MLNVASKQSDLPKIPKCDLFSFRLFLSKEKIKILYILFFLNFYIELFFLKEINTVKNGQSHRTFLNFYLKVSCYEDQIEFWISILVTSGFILSYKIFVNSSKLSCRSFVTFQSVIIMYWRDTGAKVIEKNIHQLNLLSFVSTAEDKTQQQVNNDKIVIRICRQNAIKNSSISTSLI